MQAQDDFKLETGTLTDAENTPAPVFPVPSDRQLKWNETEFYAFFHYGMNTYTGREWGNGDEIPSFAPTKKPNPKQWLETAKKAGMKGGIAVIKHHDGFCLWPTATTEHCVKNAGNEFGKQTNIPKDFAEAAKELKLKYGFYISPWIRNSRYWGKKDENGNYTDDYTKKVFFPQCACKQLAMVTISLKCGSTVQPVAVATMVAKPTRTAPLAMPKCTTTFPTCAELVFTTPAPTSLCGVWVAKHAGLVTKPDGPAKLAGRWAMASMATNAWRWHPVESDAKATSGGWFWHDGETIHSTERLFQMYLETVGRNATLILNLPPDKSGYLPDQTVKRMEEFGKELEKRLSNDLAKTAK